uniref:ORF43i n=1 Tax=Pinus koraiensis TaxID=88728 RepID=A4QM51_PINKO|nr:ORF43i [Pinus koraiensis]
MLDCFESSSFLQPVRQRTIKYLNIFPNLYICVQKHLRVLVQAV